MYKSTIFMGLAQFDRAKKGAKFLKFGQFLLYCVGNPLNSNKRSKSRVFEKVGFGVITIPGSTVGVGPFHAQVSR